jgi:hypothetical protein
MKIPHFKIGCKKFFRECAARSRCGINEPYAAKNNEDATDDFDDGYTLGLIAIA